MKGEDTKRASSKQQWTLIFRLQMLEKKKNLSIGGGFIFFFGIFTPKIGEDDPILTNISQLGWNQ